MTENCTSALAKLPAELLCTIAQCLDSTRTLMNLLCVSRHLNRVLIADFYQRLGNKPRNDALFWAIAKRSISTAQLALANGADVNHGGLRRPRWPLTRAVLSNNEDMVRLLLDAGADINKPSVDGTRPIMYAARLSASMVRLLHERGADPTLTADWGESALSLAIIHGNLEAAEFFLENGIDANGFLYDDGKNLKRTILSRCAERGPLRCLKALIRHGARARTDNDKHSRGPLVSALRSTRTEEYEDKIQTLLDAAADPDETEENGFTALYLAMKLESQYKVSVVRMLLEYGANAHAANQISATPISYCINNGHFDLVDLLVSHQGSLESKDLQRRTAASYAAENGNAMILEQCIPLNLDCGFDDSKDIYGKTPLDWAAAKGHDRSLLALLKKTDPVPPVSTAD